MFELSDISQVMGQNLGENLLPTKKNIRCDFFSSPTYSSYGGGRSRYSSSSGSGASNMFREMASSALADAQRDLRRSKTSYNLAGGSTSSSAIRDRAWGDYSALRRLSPYRSTLRQMGVDVPRMNAPWGTLIGSAVQNPWMIGGFDTDSHYVHKRDYSKDIPQMPKLSKEYMSRYFGNLPSVNIDRSYSSQLARDRSMRIPSYSIPNIINRDISSGLTTGGLYNRLVDSMGSRFGGYTRGMDINSIKPTISIGDRLKGIGSKVLGGAEQGIYSLGAPLFGINPFQSTSEIQSQMPGSVRSGQALRSAVAPIMGVGGLGDTYYHKGLGTELSIPRHKGSWGYTPSSKVGKVLKPGFGGTSKYSVKSGLDRLDTGLDINQGLTVGNETTLDAIPHTLKSGGNISSSQANSFLREYSKPGLGRSSIVTDVVKNFMKANPSIQQKIDFIRENF